MVLVVVSINVEVIVDSGRVPVAKGLRVDAAVVARVGEVVAVSHRSGRPVAELATVPQGVVSQGPVPVAVAVAVAVVLVDGGDRRASVGHHSGQSAAHESQENDLQIGEGRVTRMENFTPAEG